MLGLVVVGVVIMGQLMLLIEKDGFVLGGDAWGHIIDTANDLLTITNEFSFILELTFL